MPREDLVALYNEKAESGSPVANQKAQLILSELHRRDGVKREKKMLNMNHQMLNMNRQMTQLTWVITALTLINVALFVYQVF